MKTEQIIILVVAFFLGILLLNMVKNVCGCGVKEGFSIRELNDAVADPNSPEGTDFLGCNRHLNSKGPHVCRLSTVSYLDRGGCFGEDFCPGIESAFNNSHCSKVNATDLDSFRQAAIAAGVQGLATPCAPVEPTCTGYTPTPGYTIANDVLDMNSCASGYVGNPDVSCGTGGGNYTLSGCNPGCRTFDCTNSLGAVRSAQPCGGDLGDCDVSTCCTAFDSNKWVRDPTADLGTMEQFTVADGGNDPAMHSCDGNSGPGCDYPFVYTTNALDNAADGNGCKLSAQEDVATSGALYTLSQQQGFRFCVPNTAVVSDTSALSCTTLSR